MSNPANIPTKDQPAFPFACQGPTTGPEIYCGLSKRELYALGALIGWGGRISDNSDIDPEHVAKSCFKFADAMLKESEKPQTEIGTASLWEIFSSIWVGKTNSPEYAEAYKRACETIPNGKLP